MLMVTEVLLQPAASLATTFAVSLTFGKKFLTRFHFAMLKYAAQLNTLKPMRRKSSHHEHSQRAGAAGIPAVSWMVNGSPRERGKEGTARKRPGRPSIRTVSLR